MKLTLFTPHSFSTLLLPEKCAGQYWICATDISEKKTKVMAVEGVRLSSEVFAEQWILKSNARYKIIGEQHEVIPHLPLELLSLYRIQSADGTTEFRLYTEPLSDDRKTFRVFDVYPGNITLEIGRGSNCDIRFSNRHISKNHATLHFHSSGIIVMDNDSLNHTFVNNIVIQKSSLKTGDVIYMMGMQIIVTPHRLYINNPDGTVTIQSRWLREYHSPEFTPSYSSFEGDYEFNEFDEYYYRAPRFKYNVDTLNLTLDEPPTVQSTDNIPTIMSIGPSITMGMASATTAAFSVVNAVQNGDVRSAIPSIAMSLGMLSGTLLWPTLTKSYQKKTNLVKEAARQTAYSEYLAQMERLIQKEIVHQEQNLRTNDSCIADYLAKLKAYPLQIWERTPKHTDFLHLRLGSGRLPLNANIQYQKRHFSVEQDALLDAMYQFGEKERWLHNVPICLPLSERCVCGMFASHRLLLDYAKALILQLSILYSYDEVKLVVLYNNHDEEELSFVRWLPHVMNNEQSVRFIATNFEEAKILSSDLSDIIEYRKSMNSEQIKDALPYYIILCLDKQLASRLECLHSLLDSKENIHFSFLAMYERLKDLPKECTAVIELKDTANGILTLLNNTCENPIPFCIDIPEYLNTQQAVEVLSNTRLEFNSSSFQLPKRYTFLEMLDVGMVEHINLIDNWSSSNPTKSLAAPIGIDSYGEPFTLDIHERIHGPHGLIAGMTGSGKSETIISYILSMAINYHPHDVAFILIDYKGGGMAKAFENIPHTAGIITNLDGNAIKRSLLSMQSELHRRELIFQKVSRQHNISNIDIYKYQKLYREGKVSEPLPHLIIISDEFAELKKDQPDFMDALTSTARVGRSLGVHLILATQKPGGIVDDQIRSNSRFRLCLKVQDKGDSSEMMGRADAAELIDTGRFYLQVGNNEVFELGQSAWAGATYHPSAKVIKELDDSIAVISTNGRIISEVNTDRFADTKNARKQLDAITSYIAKISQEEHILQWRMWLDPIPSKIYADALTQKYAIKKEPPFELNPVIGEYDDPTHQKQDILRVPITTDGNTVVYGSSGSGKTMFLETLCYSLMNQHSPDEVNLYIMDFGSETMTAFSGAPHVGDVILSHEEEKVNNLFKLMYGKLERRKKVLADFGGSLQQYNLQSNTPEPNIVIIINNYANFTELYESKLGDISYLTREGTKYGIYFVLACSGVNNVRFTLLQNFKNLYCLQLNNTSDYATVVGKTGGLVPEKHLGRGLICIEKNRVLEFQTAHVTRQDPPYPFYRGFCKELTATYPGKKATRIPMLPETVSIAFLSGVTHFADLHNVPIGVEKETLDIARWDFTKQPVHMIMAANQEWKPFSNALSVLIAEKYGIETILFSPSGSSGMLSTSKQLRVCSDQNSSITGIYDVFQQVLNRNNCYKDAIAANQPIPEFKPLFVIIQSMSQLKALVDGYIPPSTAAADDTPMNRLQLAIEKCAVAYRIYFVIAESQNAVAKFTVESWYKSQVNNNGIWIGNGISSQYRLNVTKKPLGFNSTIEDNFGFLVDNGEATLVKLLQL